MIDCPVCGLTDGDADRIEGLAKALAEAAAALTAAYKSHHPPLHPRDIAYADAAIERIEAARADRARVVAYLRRRAKLSKEQHEHATAYAFIEAADAIERCEDCAGGDGDL
jgi:hypothetical protein